MSSQSHGIGQAGLTYSPLPGIPEGHGPQDSTMDTATGLYDQNVILTYNKMLEVKWNGNFVSSKHYLRNVIDTKCQPGGGEVEDILFVEPAHRAWVTFTDKVADKVLEKLKRLKELYDIDVSTVCSVVVLWNDSVHVGELEAYFKEQANFMGTYLEEENRHLFIFFNNPDAVLHILQEEPQWLRDKGLKAFLPGKETLEAIQPDPEQREKTTHTGDAHEGGSEEEYESKSFMKEDKKQMGASRSIAAYGHQEYGYNDQALHTGNYSRHNSSHSMPVQGLFNVVPNRDERTSRLPAKAETKIEPFSYCSAKIDWECLPREKYAQDEYIHELSSKYDVKIAPDEDKKNIIISGSWNAVKKTRPSLKQRYVKQHYSNDKNMVIVGKPTTIENNPSTPEHCQPVHIIIERIIWIMLKVCLSEELIEIENYCGAKTSIDKQPAAENQTCVLVISGGDTQLAKSKLEKLMKDFRELLIKMLVRVDAWNLSEMQCKDIIKTFQEHYNCGVYMEYQPGLHGIELYGTNDKILKKAKETLVGLLEKESRGKVGQLPEVTEQAMEQKPKNRMRAENGTDSKAGSKPSQGQPSVFLTKEKHPSNSPNTLFKGTFHNKVHVQVCEGDITKVKVDSIVNAANEWLNNTAGVAKAIADAAGHKLISECYSHKVKYGTLATGDVVATTGGKLYAQYVFHAVGPKWASYEIKETCAKLLYHTFLRCLKLANKRQMKSIAIPALSSGIHGVPKPVVAKAIYDATLSYVTDTGIHSYLKDIIYITIEHAVNRCIADAFDMEGKIDTSYNHRHTGLASSTSAEVYYGPKHRETSTSSITDNGWVMTEMPKEKHTNVLKTPSHKDEDGETCPICFETLTGAKKLPKCGHKFCHDCIDKSFEVIGPKCPICGKMYGALKGNQPINATMNYYKTNKIFLPGFELSATYVIEYQLPSGKQGPEHPNPGRSYKGTTRRAFLPANKEGTELLLLLKKAWEARLIFTIGQSTTTGRDDVVTWNDIHHKTNIDGGPSKFGYPDPGYLKRLREELAAKGIK